MTTRLSRRETVYLALVALAILLSFLIIWLASEPPPAHAQEFVPWTTDDVYAAIAAASAETGVSETRLIRVIWCESRFDPYAVGRSGERGLVQLHPRGLLPVFYARGYSDPYNPYEAVLFLAQRLAEGGARAWACA